MDTRAEIEEFLAEKRLAFVGVSHDPKDFSRQLFRGLRERGYDVVPVSPRGGEIDGQWVAARVQDVRPSVGGALLMIPPEATRQVVRDCHEAGVRRVWMHRGFGQGAVDPDAVAFCREHGMAVVAGECPFMFLPHAGLVHRFHHFLRRLRAA
jgi:uncharacterized protein